MLITKRVLNSQLSILSPSFDILKLSFCFLLFVCFLLWVTIKQGDLLLNRIQKLSRVINMQPRRTAFSTFSCLRDERMATTVPSYLCFCKQCISQMQTFSFQKIKSFFRNGVLFDVNFDFFFFFFCRWARRVIGKRHANLPYNLPLFEPSKTPSKGSSSTYILVPRSPGIC